MCFVAGRFYRFWAFDRRSRVRNVAELLKKKKKKPNSNPNNNKNNKSNNKKKANKCNMDKPKRDNEHQPKAQ